MIEQRRVDLSEERHDLFTALLKVNEVSTKDEGKLAEEELLGNIFIFLLAGHEVRSLGGCHIRSLFLTMNYRLPHTPCVLPLAC